jgi:hypothetical protein
MLRFLLYAALALNFSALVATATRRHWLLEQPRSSVRTLSFKQSVCSGAVVHPLSDDKLKQFNEA